MKKHPLQNRTNVQIKGGGGQRPFEQCSKKLHFSLAMASLNENDIKLVAVSRIQLLGMNKVDRQRAEKTEGIQGAYNMAVAMLRGDV